MHILCTFSHYTTAAVASVQLHHQHGCALQRPHVRRKEKKRKDYAFWRQSTENPSTIPGCPGVQNLQLTLQSCPAERLVMLCRESRQKQQQAGKHAGVATIVEVTGQRTE